MKYWIKGASGADGKSGGAGVRRRLGVWRDGDRISLTPRCNSGTHGQVALVLADELREALESGAVTRIEGATPSGLSAFVEVNRLPQHGPLDIGRAYVWIATDGDTDGWDFLGNRAELLDAARRCTVEPGDAR